MSNKPTYAQASRRLKELQYAKAQMGQLSINDEVHKKALEIALPILEQQEMITDSSEVVTDSTVSGNQWIVWCGGSVAPVDGVVEVRWSTGSTDIGHARDFRWEHSRYTINIIAYRIIPEQATNQNGEQ